MIKELKRELEISTKTVRSHRDNLVSHLNKAAFENEISIPVLTVSDFETANNRLGNLLNCYRNILGMVVLAFEHSSPYKGDVGALIGVLRDGWKYRKSRQLNR